MQEIIPYIENSWKFAENKETKVSIVNIDELSLEQIIPLALQCSHIVLTCFNFKVFKIAVFIRENLALPINFIIYVHNMATIAFWPFRKWAATDFFKTHDLFISSCENDQKTLNTVFINPKIAILPFYFLHPVENYLNKPFSQISELLYIGRISPQKNLHNLVLAYALIKKRNSISLPKLTLFGKEDDLGSPNMNIIQTGYQKYLSNLVNQLSLQEEIIFKGHQSRDRINEFLYANQCLTVSPSLHSDENFGMAVLQSLVAGNRCLISDWGGHSDFKKYFPDRTALMQVSSSKWGPSLSAQVIADSIENLLANKPIQTTLQIDAHYTDTDIFERVHKFLELPYINESLKFTTLSENIYQQKTQNFSKSQMQIFKDYSDPLFLKISANYIGSTENNYIYAKNRHYGFTPWLNSSNDDYKISDPHKGELQIIADSEIDIMKNLYDGGYLINEN